MASVNMAILMGNAGKDPVIKVWNDGKKQAQFSIATSETWNDKKTGEKKEKTEWHNIVCNEPLSGIVEKYVKKGTSVHVTGKITQRSWDECDQKKYITEIVVNQLQLCGSKPSDGGQSNQGSNQQSNSTSNSPYNPNDPDDLPF
jgi:single-strand DNA-binding protein